MNPIQISRDAMGQALEVLKKHVEYFDYPQFTSLCELDAAKDCIIVLTAALAQADQPAVPQPDPPKHGGRPMTMREIMEAEEKPEPQAQAGGRDWSLLEATQESLREHTAMIREMREAIAKKDAEAAELRAALVGCVGVLENARGCLQAAQAEGLEERLMEDTTDTRLKDLVERRLLHAFYPLDAAITQAQGVLG